jgi:hypothetical protein
MNDESQNGGGMGDQLKALVSSLTQSVGPAKPFNKSEVNNPDVSSKLFEDLKKVTSDIEQSVRENKNLVKKISDLIMNMGSREKGNSSPVVKDFVSGGLDKDASSALLKMASYEKKVSPVEAKFFKAGLQKGSIQTHDYYMLKEFEKLNATAIEIRDCLCGDKKEKTEKKLVLPEDFEATPPVPKSSIEDTSVEDNAESLRLKFEELFVLKRYRSTISEISKVAAKIQESFMGFTAFNKITEDLIKQEREFAQQVRAVAYETMGITRENKKLQHVLTNINESSAITGFNRTETEKLYVNNLKKGIRDQKIALKLSNTQLNTEKLIGLEAGGLGEVFSDMSLQMDMNTSQMVSFGRGIKDVARNTGITGQNLAKAVQSSESIMKNYRNAANFNATAAKSAVGVMASAEKFGVAEGMGQIMSTVSQGLHGFANASTQMQTFLARVSGGTGKVREMMDGTWLQTKEGMKSFTEGINLMVEDFAGVSLDQIEKMTTQERSRLDFKLRSATGFGIGEIRKISEAAAEESETLKEKIIKVNKQKKAALDFEKKALEDKERSLKTSGTLDVLSRLNESAKGAKNMEEALASFQRKLPAMREDLNALGISDRDAKSAGKEALQAAIAGVNEGLKKAKKQELKVNTKDIEKAMNDPAAFKALTDEIESKNQELGVTQKSQTDILSDMNQTLTVLNATLRNRIQGFLGNLLDSTLGKFVYFTSAAAGGMTDIAWKISNIAVGLKNNEIARFAAEKGLTKLISKFGFGIESLGFATSSVFNPAAITAARTTLMYFGSAVAAATALAGAIHGSISAGQNAAELFGKSMEEVTMAEFYAAKGAGAITGALNFLTFGIFDNFLGSTGIITNWLAQFNKMIPILSAVMAVIDIVAGAIWGIMLSIKDVFVGAFEMVYLILEPFGTLIHGIGDAIGIILSPLFSFTSGLENTGSLFKIFADIFGVFGKVLRGIMRTIGFIIGGLLKIFIGILVPLIKGVAYFLSIFTNTVGYVFNTIAEGVMGILEFFQGLFTLDFAKMGRGLWNVFSTIIMGIPNLVIRVFSSIPGYVYEAMFNIGSVIISSIWSFVKMIPSIFAGLLLLPIVIGSAILRGIYNLPGVILGGLASIGSSIIGWFTSIPGQITTSLTDWGSAIFDWFTSIPAKIWNWLVGAAQKIPGLGRLFKGMEIKDKPITDKKSLSLQEDTTDAITKLAEEGTRKGSLYTHDIYLERQLIALNSMLAFSNMGGALTGLIGSISNIGGFISKSVSSVFSGIYDKITGATAVASKVPSLIFLSLSLSIKAPMFRACFC